MNLESLVGKDFMNSNKATIHNISEQNKTKNENQISKVLTKKRVSAYKYSNRGKGDLYEAIIVDGIPYFLTFNSTINGIELVSHIEEKDRIIFPPEINDYPYEPYEFRDKEEITSYIDDVVKQDRDTLFKMIRQTISQYNDQEEFKLNIVTSDVFRSYFQDRFSTTHYDILVGPPGSGKSSLGDTFGAIAYRAVNMTDPTAANLYRLLGGIEHGQCTIILEEADRIDQSDYLMAVLKTGYSMNGRVARINMNTGKQEFFFSYGIKIIIGERSPSYNAKGVLDRSFVINCYRGSPKYDIKEILNPTNTGGSEHRLQLTKLNDLRKRLLAYRLIHFKDPIPDLDIGISGRDKELVKSSLQLFAGTKSEQKIVETMQKLLDLKNQRKETSLESRLLLIIYELISRCGSTFPFKIFWAQLTYDLAGETDEKKPNDYHTEDYGTIHRNTITNLLQDKFGAQTKHTKNGNVLVFDLGNILKLLGQHNTKISVKIKWEDEPGESSEYIMVNKDKKINSESQVKHEEPWSKNVNSIDNIQTPDPNQPSRSSQGSPHLKLLKCPQCKFKNIHLETLEHHIKWSHNKGE